MAEEPPQDQSLPAPVRALLGPPRATVEALSKLPRLTRTAMSSLPKTLEQLPGVVAELRSLVRQGERLAAERRREGEGERSGDSEGEAPGERTKR